MKKKLNWNIKSKHILTAVILVCVGLMIFTVAAEFPVTPVKRVAAYAVVPFRRASIKLGLRWMKRHLVSAKNSHW